MIREDGNGEVNIAELLEVRVHSAEEMLNVIEVGNQNRTTHATESNEESSRSHAICQVILKKYDTKGRQRVYGKLSLIDLAGSERGTDTKHHNRTRRMEGAEINKSLLALKECIRALDSNSNHVPYRASKLTLVLKDSFTRNNARTVMVVNISPAASSADHTLNTLRYADRIKETAVGDAAARAMAGDSDVEPVHERSPSPRVTPPPPSGKIPLKPPAVPPPAASKNGAGVAQKSPIMDLHGKPSAIQHTPVSSKHPLPPSQKSHHAAPKPRHNDDSSDEDLAYEEVQDNYGFDDDLGRTQEEKELDKTIQSLFEEEEELLNLHMNNIQENAELLTEEGRLLQQLQCTLSVAVIPVHNAV